MFNEYFYKQFSEPSHYETNIDFTNDSYFDIDFSAARVKPLLDSLDINKAQGPDGINGSVLKNCSETLSYSLSILFNLVYNTDYTPQEWKVANVVPVYKKDDKNKVTNYRPISLTSLVMKVLERIIYDELLCRTINKIDTRQHGFIRNRSCNTNLLLFTESIARFLRKSTVSDLSLNSNYISTYKTVERIGHMISEFEIKIKYISKQIDNIEKSILDHSALINNLERDICRFADIHFNYQSNPNPESITSPVSGSHTPTAIPELNSRALYFNSLLFAQKHQWGLLGFDAFCDSSGLLAPVYRRYSDKNDRIHLGFRELTY